MARYIDADKLLEQVNSLAQLARKRVYDTPTNSPVYQRYSTQFQEREKILTLIEVHPAADVVPKSEVERLEQEIKALVAFKDYFSDLYGHGLEVANWHENGTLEPFDNFYESAEDEYEAELKKKYTE